MKIKLKLLAPLIETIHYPSKKVAGQMDKFDKMTIQCLDNENKVCVFSTKDITPFQAVPQFMEIEVSVTYDMERAEYSNAKLLTPVPVSAGGPLEPAHTDTTLNAPPDDSELP